MTLAGGTRIGVYELLELIGAGGMGEVYRAKDTRLQRFVAIKILPAEWSGDADRMKRLEREALMLAALNHPNIAHVHGLEDAVIGGVAVRALVMELVEGRSLAEHLLDGPMRWDVARPIVLQIIDALDASHSAGIIHRDLKPGNICISRDGLVKVIDFGLAKASPDATDLLTRTATVEDGDRISGTVQYMSPEQARGTAVDKRTDLWALGCIVFETLSGRRPFNGATWTELVVAICEKDVDWSALPATSPAGVRLLLGRCLAKDLRSRLRDAGDARAFIEDAANPSETSPASPPWIKALPWAVALSLAALLGAVLTVGTTTAGPAVPEFGRAVRLTSGPATELGPAISPDGKWVAYLSDGRGPTDLIVQYVAGGETINLTASSGLQLPTRIDIGGPSIHPDGSLITFDAGAKPGTPANLFDAWVVPAPLGGIPRKLVERGRGLRWSPDGSRIAYVRAGAAAGDALYVANADGSNEREILPTRGGMHVHWIQWSHDGESIYYNYSNSTANVEPAEIHRIPVSGGTGEPVVQTPRRAVFPIPMPDGHGLLYSANPETSDLGLWWRSSDGRVVQRITAGIGEYAEPSVSRDGQRLVATLIEWERSLVRLDLDRQPAVLEPLLRGSTDDLDPTIAPDGLTIVFSSTRGGQRTLWTAKLSDGVERPLSSGAVRDERPAISPNGQRLAFVSDRDGKRGIWTMNADGGAPRLLVHADVLDAVSWSPDGNRIVYAAPAGAAPGLWIAAVADGSITRVNTGGPATSPAWAPNRDLIAYVEARPPAPEAPSSSRVSAITSAGEPVDVASGPNVLNGFLAWSADGNEIIAVVDPGAGPAAVWAGPVDKVKSFRRILEAPPHVRFRGATGLPGQRAIVLGQTRRSADVVLFDRVK